MLNINNETSRDSISYPDESSEKKIIPLATFSIGMILDDKYEIKREIARGGMGIVYEAYHRYVHRRVAIKIALSSKMNTDQLERFKREIESYSRLSHPNIIQIYDAGMYNNRPYLVMEYIEGVDICQYVAQQKEAQKASENTDPNMYWKLCASLIYQVALGLDHLHKHFIIHRDIKPSNIIVRPNGSPVIIDLGLAKFLQESSVKLTMKGDYIGTPQYMPIEQVQGRIEGINAQSDIYSLGLVLYELLTGKIAYSGTTILEICYKIMEYYPPRPREINPQVPQELDEITMHAIQKQQKDRFSNAQEFADALKKYLSDLYLSNLNEKEVIKVDLNDSIGLLNDTFVSNSDNTISLAQSSSTSLKIKSTKLKTQLATIKKQQRLQEQEKIRKQSKNNLYYIVGVVALFLVSIIGYSLTGTKVVAPNQGSISSTSETEQEQKNNVKKIATEQNTQESIKNTPATEQKQENIKNTPVVEQKQKNIANTPATEQNTQENINNTPTPAQKPEEKKFDFKVAKKLFEEGNFEELSINKEAKEYFEKIANQGNAQAQLLLGYMHYFGCDNEKGIYSKDKKTARKYFEEVATNKNASNDEIVSAKLCLGCICYDNKEFESAKSYFEEVQDIQEVDKYLLEILKILKIQTTENRKKEEKFDSEVAKKLLEAGNFEELSINKEAREYFEKVANQGNAQAQLLLGYMHYFGCDNEKGIYPKDKKTARKYFEEVAKNKNATNVEIVSAKLCLGCICYDNKELESAKAYFEEVAKNKNASNDDIESAKLYLGLL